jgi:Rrf2 family transcriptional regulator, iron-sulfur cluster assembly transcription factor
MRMQLGRRADYSVRAVLHLARHGGKPGRQKAKQISGAMGIPENYIPQVLAALVRTGTVESEPGPDGGYRLAVDPSRITLLQLIESIDGPVRSDECILRGGVCAWTNRCAIHETWSDAQDALRATLHDTTFADLTAARSDSGD